MNSVDDVWKKVLKILAKDLTVTAINTWFIDCRAVEFSNSRLYIHTSSVLKKEVIEDRFTGSIKNALNELFSGEIDITVLDDDGLIAYNEASAEPDYSSSDEYTFERFVVGSSNKLAHAGALAVAEGTRNYNPLFIYGEAGLGKTHLLYAIRNFVEEKFPHYNIAYVKGDDFTNEFITAVQKGKNVEFREKYRGADLFLIDDIQFIAGKKQTQEEFFHTFNTLYELGKQIVLTSDRHPSEITLLVDRLQSRFESGFVADIQPPDDALRIAIIRNKAEQLGVIMPDDVTNYIADNLNSNVRQLEGAVQMIIAYRDIMDDDITVDSVKTYLKDLFKGSRDLIPTVDVIIEETANYYMLLPEDLKGQNRQRNVTLARHVAMYLIRKFTNLSLVETGALFENRDHTTVISSIKVVEKKMKESQEFSGIIKDITSNIQNSKR